MAPAAGCCSRFTGEPDSPTKRSQLAARWSMLSLLCMTLVGSYYCYDNPAAIQNSLADYFGNGDASVDDDGTNTDTSSFSFRFNLLYSVYSWPNVILPFFGGYLSDRLGVRLMAVVFILLITVGQAVFAFGLTLSPDTAAPWYVMWAGRTIFGFGGESLSVAQSAMIAQWFAGRELAFGQAANLAIARIGSVINDVISVQLATHFPVYWALWAGLLVCVLSCITGVWSYYLDERSEDKLRTNLGYRPLKRTGLVASLLCLPYWRRRLGSAKQLQEDEEEALAAQAGGGVDEPPKEEIHITAARKFPFIFWVLCLSCVTVYIAVLPFNGIASGFIAQKWLANGKPLSQVPDDQKNSIFVTANGIMLTTYLVAGCIAPVMGAAIDRVGYRAILNCVAALAIVVSANGGVCRACCREPSRPSFLFSIFSPHHFFPLPFLPSLSPFSPTARAGRPRTPRLHGRLPRGPSAPPGLLLRHLRLRTVALHRPRHRAGVPRNSLRNRNVGTEPGPRGRAHGHRDPHALP
jgi:MFS family permease